MEPTNLPERLQLLEADGTELRGDANEAEWAVIDALPTETLVDMARSMVVTRDFDAEAGHLQRQGKLGLWVPSIGQEGGQAGVVFAMRDQDTLFPSYREHLMVWQRGVTFPQILDIFRGAAHGGWNPADTRGARIYSLVIATQALHGVGYGMGVRFEGASGTGDVERDEAVVICHGDGATSEGDASEGLVFAASYETPTVFVVQNNKWAISVPAVRQSRGSLAARGAGFGLDARHVDGNDALASYAAARTMLDTARTKNRPQYLELDTYRIGAHTTSDDPTRYRSSEELELWQGRDPILRLKRYLTAAREVGEEVFAEHAEEGRQVAADCRAYIASVPPPASGEMFAHVYSEPHPVIQEQRKAHERFEASLGGAA